MSFYTRSRAEWNVLPAEWKPRTTCRMGVDRERTRHERATSSHRVKRCSSIMWTRTKACAARKSTTDPFRVPDVCTSKAAESNVSFLRLATTALQVQEAFESIHQHGRPFARLLQPRWILVPRVFHAAPLRFRFTFLASSPEGSC